MKSGKGVGEGVGGVAGAEVWGWIAGFFGVRMMGATIWSTLPVSVCSSVEGIPEALYPILIRAGKSCVKR